MFSCIQSQIIVFLVLTFEHISVNAQLKVVKHMSFHAPYAFLVLFYVSSTLQ